MEAVTQPPFAAQAQKSALERCEAFIIKAAKMAPIILAGAVVIFLIYYFIKGIYFMLGHKKRINANWPKYRCKPYILPFAGWFVGPGSTNPATNFVECSFSVQRSYYDVLKQDFMQMFGSLAEIVKDQQIAIQEMRNMTNYMRNSMKQFAEDIYQKMYDAYYRIASLFKVFMGAFGSLFNLFSESFNVLLYGYYTLQSMWNGPIGIVGRGLYDITNPIRDVVHFFCFSPDTPILMADGRYKRAREIKLGHQLGMNAGEVIACMEIDGTNADMYRYNDCVEVSGSHMLKENGKWIRVEDSMRSEPIEWNGRNIICFNTTSNRIPVAGHLFADYMETNDNATRTMMQAVVLHRLNEGEPIAMDSKDLKYPAVRCQYDWALDAGTKVEMFSGLSKCIRDIKIGDKISMGGYVQAIIKVAPTEGQMYSYCGEKMTGTHIVLNGDQWIEVRDAPLAQPCEPRAMGEGCYRILEPLYNIVTTNGVIKLQSGILTTDFQQSTCEKTSVMIDEYVEKIFYS